MLRLIGLVVSIGLADSLNPSTLGPALFLAAGDRPRPDVIRFLLAVFAVFFLGGVVLTLGPGEAILALVPHPDATARYIAETVAGVAMLVASVLLWRKHEALGRRRHVESRPKQHHSPALLGAGIAVVELPTAFPYFAAIVAIVGSGLDIGRQLILLLLYNVCFVLPMLGIVITLTVAGDQAERVLLSIREYFRRHWPELVSVVALLAGIFITVLGVTGLLSGSHGRVGTLSRHLRRVISR
jgi:cytochrome c biogenesis protein CcdA